MVGVFPKYYELTTLVQAQCLRFWEQCRAVGSALFSIFQRNRPDFAHHYSLAHRTIRLGGVENTGNSCIFAAMLQDFAALPHYDSFLSIPLEKGPSESGTRFTTRQNLQRQLHDCVERIRNGTLVERSEVRALADQLQRLGWQGHVSSDWRNFLYRLAPGVFPLPQFSVYELYERTLSCLLEEVTSDALKIVFSGKEDASSFEDFFSSRRELTEVISTIIWRIALQSSPTALEEHFQIGPWEFFLSVVHAHRMISSEKHVVAYRKCEGEWICCNDTQITPEAPLPTDTIYTVVYESRRL